MPTDPPRLRLATPPRSRRRRWRRTRPRARCSPSPWSSILATACAIGVAAFLLRRDPTTFGIDQEIEAWAGRVSTAWSDEALRTLTHLGDTETVIVLATVAAAWYAWRRRSATAFAFLAVVIVGQWVTAETVRAIVERARPALSPRAGFSGASFPSGHSTAATACYLAIAFVMTAGLPRRERAALIGAGAGIGVAVASTRVLLGVHWFTDAVAGVALGASIALLAHAAFARRPRWWRTREVTSAENADSIRSWPGREPTGASTSTTSGSSSTGRAATRTGEGSIFHPGTPVSRVFGRWAHAAAVATGVRLITVNRPGYGGSTTTVGARPSLLAVGRDTAALARHLGLGEYAVGRWLGRGTFRRRDGGRRPRCGPCRGTGRFRRAVAAAPTTVGVPRGSGVPRAARRR